MALTSSLALRDVLISLLALKGGAEGLGGRAQSLSFHARPLALGQAVVKADETPPRFADKDGHGDKGLNVLSFQMPCELSSGRSATTPWPIFPCLNSSIHFCKWFSLQEKLCKLRIVNLSA